MASFKYKSGLGNVGSYQASAIPYITGALTIPVSSSSPKEISFPSVTSFLVIRNTLPGSATNVPLRFGFSSNGISGANSINYDLLNNGESFEANFRVARLYLLSDHGSNECSASVVAGLTTINSNELTSNWSGSIGVG